MSESCYIEYCTDCWQHSWCTRHKEGRYAQFFTQLQTEILRNLPDVRVYPNVVPIGFSNKFFTDSENILAQKGSKIRFPRVGAFEVYYDGQVIFSKLETGNWPNAKVIVSKLNQLIEEKRLPKITPEKSKKKFRIVRRKKKRIRKTKSSEPLYFHPSGNVQHMSPQHPKAQTPYNRGKSSKPGFRLRRDETEPVYLTPFQKRNAGLTRGATAGHIKKRKAKKVAIPAPIPSERKLRVQRLPEINLGTKQADLSRSRVEAPDPEPVDANYEDDDFEEAPFFATEVPLGTQTAPPPFVSHDLTTPQKPATESEGPREPDESEYSDDNYSDDDHDAVEVTPVKEPPPVKKPQPEFIKEPSVPSETPSASDSDTQVEEEDKFDEIGLDEWQPSQGTSTQIDNRPGTTAGSRRQQMTTANSETSLRATRIGSGSDLLALQSVNSRDEESQNDAPMDHFPEPSNDDEVISSYEEDYDAFEIDESDDEDGPKPYVKSRAKPQPSDLVESVEQEEEEEDYGPKPYTRSHEKPPEEPQLAQPAAEASESEGYEDDDFEEPYEDDEFEEEDQPPAASGTEEPVTKSIAGAVNITSGSLRESPFLSEFEESEGEQEPEQISLEVTKSYNITVKVGRMSNKKITYANSSDQTHTFELSSSDPNLMQLKEDLVPIDSESTGKFQLRFEPVDEACMKTFYLYVNRNGRPYELIEIIVSYV